MGAGCSFLLISRKAAGMSFEAARGTTSARSAGHVFCFRGHSVTFSLFFLFSRGDLTRASA